MPCFSELPDEAFVRISSIVGPKGVLPYSKATLYNNIGRGLFPQPYKLGSRVSAWKVGEVREALAAFKQQVNAVLTKND